MQTPSAYDNEVIDHDDNDKTPKTRDGWLRAGFVEIPGFPGYLYRPSHDESTFDPEVVSFKRSDQGRRLKTALVGEAGRGYSLWREPSVAGSDDGRVDLSFRELYNLCFPGGVPAMYFVVEIVPDDDGDNAGLPGLIVHPVGRVKFNHPMTVEQARGACENLARGNPGRRFGYTRAILLETCMVESVRWESTGDVPF